MNVENVGRGSRFYKRLTRIVTIYGVPSVRPKDYRGFYLFLAQAPLNLLTDVQADRP